MAWVSLDRFDDDPAALLALLASAYARISPGTPTWSPTWRPRCLGAGTRRAAPRLGVPDQPRPVRADAGRPPRAALAGLPRRAERGHRRVPRGSQVVVASRAEQPHLPRLRAAGDALELLAGDLALDAAGAAQIFSEAQVSLTPRLPPR